MFTKRSFRNFIKVMKALILITCGMYFISQITKYARTNFAHSMMSIFDENGNKFFTMSDADKLNK